MKLLLNIICGLYTILIHLGIKINPPSILFNNPKRKFEPEIIEEIHADTTFTKKERLYILQAAEDWVRFSNNQIHFQIVFDFNLIDYDQMKDKSTLIRIHSSAQIIKKSDEKIKSTTLGLCYYTTDTIRTIYLVFDRLTCLNTLRATTMHELGHYINLDHTEGHSIMNKCIMYDILYPTYADAVEFAKKLNCRPKDCKYIKV